MMMRYGKKFYNKYKDYILFNKNIIIAGTAALIVGTFFTQFFAQQSKDNFLNSIVTLFAEYGIYPHYSLFFFILIAKVDM
jgi:hypothetical protein